MSNHNSPRVAIVGAGLSGLSVSYHLGHDGCMAYEARRGYGGHLMSHERDGFVWDEGPHVSFTKDEYVKGLFSQSVGGQYEEFDARVGNYYRGHWIDHPAQSNLFQVPEPLRSRCLESFRAEWARTEPRQTPCDYREWLVQTFGEVFAETFPVKYTEKYWTTAPENLGIDWVGRRVFQPNLDDIVDGSKSPLRKKTHYIKRFRYPTHGGFVSYTRALARGAHVHFGKRLTRVDLRSNKLFFSDGSSCQPSVVVSTIPLPSLISLADNVPGEVREATSRLRCTEVLLVNVAVNHPSRTPYHWLYVYDGDKLSTRISVIEHLSPNNAPSGQTGLQVEVYGSHYRLLPGDHEGILERVLDELVEMGLVESHSSVVSAHSQHLPWGNVIFDHERKAALATVNEYLDQFNILRVGRYAEWKYYWTDDCVLAGKRAAERILDSL